MIKHLSLIKIFIIVIAVSQISGCSNYNSSSKAGEDSVANASESNLSVDTDTGLGISVENGDISNIFSKAKDKIASVFTTGDQQAAKTKDKDRAVTSKKEAMNTDDWRGKRQWWQRGTPVL